MNYSDPGEAMRAVTKALNDIEVNKISKVFNEIIIEGVAMAKKECPIDQGQLRADIHFEIEESRDRIEAQIGNKLKYAPYVHNGTGVYAVNGDGRKTPWKYPALAGKYKGWHYTKGQKPQPYLKITLDNLKKTFPKRMAKSIEGGVLWES